MIRTRGTVSYVSASGTPTLTSEYALTEDEEEIVRLHATIRAEATSPGDRLMAPVYALAALPCPDPVFVEWITGGTFTMREVNGRMTLVGSRADGDAVLLATHGWWSRGS